MQWKKTAPCPVCGTPSPMVMNIDDTLPILRYGQYVYSCPQCHQPFSVESPSQLERDPHRRSDDSPSEE